MIRYYEKYSVKKLNTFGVKAKTNKYFEFTEPEDLTNFLSLSETENKNFLILGGGSNMLFVNDFEGTIIRPNIPGISEIDETRQHVWIEVGAGENWDEFVRYCVLYNLGGIENLSAIPGTVGAAPVQNIGAYGQEVANSVERVNCFDLSNNEIISFTNQECNFDYRSSIFKTRYKNKMVITSVVFKLEKFAEYNLNYGNLEEKVKEKGNINLLNIRETICEIRASKLPDPKKIGNAGSFFKNPLIESAKAEELKKAYPQILTYPDGSGMQKLAAGWLIENAGWKGFREGDAGVHENQALVLVNYSKATGQEILALANKISSSVYEKFGVKIEPEVNIISDLKK